MRKDFETPMDFAMSKKVREHIIKYENLMEFAQGSPAIGQLTIDNVIINQEGYFGGPFLHDESYLYIPMYVQSFFNSGFKLVKINLKSKVIEILIEKKKTLFFLDSLKNGILYYYNNMD